MNSEVPMWNGDGDGDGICGLSYISCEIVLLSTPVILDSFSIGVFIDWYREFLVDSENSSSPNSSFLLEAYIPFCFKFEGNAIVLLYLWYWIVT